MFMEKGKIKELLDNHVNFKLKRPIYEGLNLLKKNTITLCWELDDDGLNYTRISTINPNKEGYCDELDAKQNLLHRQYTNGDFEKYIYEDGKLIDVVKGHTKL